MNNRLLNFLKNYEASERITELKLDSKMVNAEDENKQTALQLAAHDGRSDIVLLLVSEGAEIKPINENIRFHHPLVVQILAACRDKKSDPAIIAGIHCYALRQKAQALSARVAKHLPAPLDIEAKFTTRQRTAYDYAVNGNKAMMMNGCQNKIENYATLFAHAYAVKNYAALQIILSGCDTHIKLLEHFLTTEQNDCARFFIVAAAMDLYELALYFHKENSQAFKKLIHLVWSKTGLLQGLIERSILEKLPANDIPALIKTLQKETKEDDVNLLFERAVSQRYPIRFTVKTSNKLSIEDNELVYNLGCRLNIFILRSGEDELSQFVNYFPSALHDIILNYCDPDSQKHLSSSSFLKHRLGLIHAPVESKKAAQIQHLNMQLRLLNEFVIAAEEELASKTCWSHPGQLYKTHEKLIFLFIFIGLVISSGLLGHAVPRRNALREILGKEQFPSCVDFFNNHCFEYGSQDCLYKDYREDHEQCVVNDACTGCPEFNSLYGMVVGSSVSVGILGFIFLLLMGGAINSFRSQQPQRFNDLPITSYQTRTRGAAERMLTEYKGTQFNPFEECSMKSKVGDVLGIARRERDIKQGLLTSLTFVARKRRVEHKIDIDESDVGSLDVPLLERKR